MSTLTRPLRSTENTRSARTRSDSTADAKPGVNAASTGALTVTRWPAPATVPGSTWAGAEADVKKAE